MIQEFIVSYAFAYRAFDGGALGGSHSKCGLRVFRVKAESDKQALEQVQEDIKNSKDPLAIDHRTYQVTPVEPDADVSLSLPAAVYRTIATDAEENCRPVEDHISHLLTRMHEENLIEQGLKHPNYDYATTLESGFDDPADAH